MSLVGQAVAAAPALLQVQLSAKAPTAESGRILLFAQPWDQAKTANNGADPISIDGSDFHPTSVAVAAQDVSRIAPGETVWVDADHLAFPSPFSALKPGVYAVQAVLDVGRDYNYEGRGPEDSMSPVMKITLGAGEPPPVLALQPGHAALKPFELPATVPAAIRDKYTLARADIDQVDFVSPALSRFWGRDIHMRGWVLHPPGYDPIGQTRYPTVYWTHGFGGDLNKIASSAVTLRQAMAAGQIPPMFYVLLDQSTPLGAQEFADSVNNGPWGEALTRELIPALEQQYRMDAAPSGRFLTGHSSGGWAALWLQVRYPKLFGGAWATSPDPSDFHDFNGVDLYAPGANVYRGADGAAHPLVRDHAKVLASFEDFAHLERVLGDRGGQMGSFDAVFSPRGSDGRPMPMFDRDTGAVDPAVMAYWRDHFDIAYRITQDWPALKPDLDGKLHVAVGTADSFYLDGAAHRLKAALDSVGAVSEFRFIPDRTHFDVYTIDDDRRGLEKQIAWSIYRTARPQTALKAKP